MSMVATPIVLPAPFTNIIFTFRGIVARVDLLAKIASEELFTDVLARTTTSKTLDPLLDLDKHALGFLVVRDILPEILSEGKTIYLAIYLNMSPNFPKDISINDNFGIEIEQLLALVTLPRLTSISLFEPQITTIHFCSPF